MARTNKRPGISVFISYSSSDRVFVTEQVVQVLEEAAIVPRLAETEPHPDEDWAAKMHKLRQDAEWFLVIVSEASTKSDWIRDEVEWALQERKGRILSVVLSGGDPAAIHPGLAKLSSVHVDPADSVNCREELTKVAQRITESSDEERSEPTAPTAEVGSITPPSEAVDDGLIDRLVERKLAISTVARGDTEGARSLLEGPTRWRLGPSVDAGDFLLIYFPKGLAQRKEMRRDGPPADGLRFILRDAEKIHYPKLLMHNMLKRFKIPSC